MADAASGDGGPDGMSSVDATSDGSPRDAALDTGADAAQALHRCSPATGHPCRAMWVWATPDNATLVSFATAHGVQELFYSVSSAIAGAELARLQELRALASDAGIMIDALSGDPTWAITAVASALAWEDDALATGLFDGIHLDIEPMQLADWSSNTAADALAFVTAMQQIRAHNPAVHLELDCQFSYGTIPVAGYPSLADALSRTVSEITIMSYRNTNAGTNGMFGVAEDELARGQDAGIAVRLGAETNDVQPAEITFFGMTNTQMQAVLASVDSASAAYSAYKGIAVEDYTGWSALSP